MKKFVNEVAKFTVGLSSGIVVAIIAILLVTVGYLVSPVEAAAKDELEVTETTFTWRATNCNPDNAKTLAYAYNTEEWDGELIYSTDGKHIASVNRETGRIWIDNQDTAYSVDYKYAAGEFLLRTADGTYLKDLRSEQITLYKQGVEVAKVESIELPENEPAEPLKLGDQKLFHILQDSYYDKTWDGQNIEVSNLPYGWQKTNEYQGVFARVAYNHIVYVNNSPMFHLGSNQAWRISSLADNNFDISNAYMQTFGQTIFTLTEDGIRGESLNTYVSAGPIDCLHLSVPLEQPAKSALVRAYSDYAVIYTVEQMVDGKLTYQVFQTLPGDESRLIAENVISIEADWLGITLVYTNGSKQFLQMSK